uniref:Uncharacterized protein n=1 Tax=Chromera velia CCMP2878 TaxID=1169474 RepID=A0A0G4GHT1_9ALVE|eukprot:Cvel_21956.t1-p1 / transcript=Cvel_21956.t1 / gene=Cvel_21956 / organism=Chromera_velia_CCMP2878 / gene_product=hypothetical protein / transcript_product=hypothetical protein / location=Cvel_scaffold2109:857-1279(-) / protein_length=141 / sequence_SO=supercontig / SO=protein_coding / is_pseudo=false
MPPSYFPHKCSVSGVQEQDHIQKRGALFPLQPPVTGVNRQDISKQLAPTHQLELDGGKMPTVGMLSSLEDDGKVLSSGVGPLLDVSFPTPTLRSLHSLSRTDGHVTIGKGLGTDPRGDDLSPQGHLRARADLSNRSLGLYP